MTQTANTDSPGPDTSASVPLVGIAEIHALLIEISKQRVEELTFRSDFPEPAAELAEGDVWLLEDVQGWLNEHGEVMADIFKNAR